jgi:hypothetical protein
MVRNINVCNKHVKKHKKEYIKPLRALREGLYVKAELSILHIKMPLTHLSLTSGRKIRIGIESQLMIMVQLQGLYLRRRLLMKKFDSCDEHSFYIN